MSSSVVLRSAAALRAMQTALVVAAVVAGLLAGALSCAIGLAQGVDHADHAVVDDDDLWGTSVDPASSALTAQVARPANGRSAHGHSHGVTDRDGQRSIESDRSTTKSHAAVFNSAADPATNTSPESEPASPTSHVGDAHPGMACVTSEKFGTDELVVPTTTHITTLRPTAQPLGCQYAPEPPVPKFS